MSALCPKGLSFREYQKEGIAFCRGKRAVLIGDEMGVGKTPQAIGIINANCSVKSVCVVCPASLKLMWERELNAWLLSVLSVGVAKGKKFPDTDIVIINYDILKANKAALTKRWDILIVDECHYAKNKDAARTKGTLAIKASTKIFMSGTPLANRPKELWPILHSLAPSEWGTYHEYGTRYCAAYLQTIFGFDPRTRKMAKKQVWNYDGASNLAELNTKLAPFMIRRLKKDVLSELPPKVRRIVELDGGKTKVIDKDTWRKAVALLEHDETEAEFEEMSEIRHEQAVEKMPEAIKYIKLALDSGSSKVIVFAHHVDVLDGLIDGLAAFGVTSVTGGMSDEAKQKAVDSFQKDQEVRVFVGSLRAAGVGLTLTAASHVIFAELDWVPAIITQAEDRAHRMGQKDSVLVEHLVAARSLDARMARTLVHKQSVLDATIDGSISQRSAPQTDTLLGENYADIF